ncbi:amino acid ABC transporter permease [Caballeronia sp. dw_276]|uniref:amino acid ABC transporter permease n=1 Tax=Caballeronia sp. dw_276 TaxID=2719795 RepID=UPI001BD4D247|nr:amino acid ABC transporter permease [Caballeronia sp. dw_276]
MSRAIFQTAGATSTPIIAKPIQWGQTAIGAAAILILFSVALVVGRSQSIQWPQIGRYLFHPTILRGVLLTLELTAAAMLFGIAVGCAVAIMAISRNLVLKVLSAAFVWLFRGVPLIVQIFFWFNIALFIPQLRFGTATISINEIITPSLAGFLALALHEAANMAEIIRGGLLSVDQGQQDAGRSLGFTGSQTLRVIVLPQAARVIIPPTGNQAIGMLKASAIVSVIGMEDLLTQAQHIYAQNFLVIELLIVASIWYLAVTTLASLGQYFIERRLVRHARSSNKSVERSGE